MNGFMIKLPIEVTDHTLPKLWEHPLMSEGSLMLLDASNSYGLPAGDVNTAGTLIPNIAWETCKAILGTGDKTSLSPTVNKTLTAAQGYAELTSKKGIHTIMSQTAHNASTYYSLNLPATIIAYINANLGHEFFVSIWAKNTKVTLAGSKFQFALLFKNTANNLIYTTPVGTGQDRFVPNPTDTNRRITAEINTLNPYIKNIKTGAITGAAPDAINLNATGNVLLASGGGVNAYATPGNNTWPSTIRYQTYLEDLTVSGRTYAQVDAIDLALFTEAFAPGGKFHGDTFTDPSTLP